MVDPDEAAYPSRRATWLVLAFGCLAGLSTYLVTPLEQPDQLMLASDVYRHAAQSWLADDGLYGIHPEGRPGYTFLYPPITVLVFLPHAVLGSDVAAYALQTGLNGLAALGTTYVIYRGLQRRGVDVDRRDLGMLAAFMLLSSYSAIQFLNGQINLWLALAIAIGFEAVDRNRSVLAGGAFAIAASLKVFPAVLGIWLLRDRSTKAVAVAIGTGVGGLVLGAILLGPELTWTYLTEVLLERFEGSTYEGRPSPEQNVDGIHRQLAAVWPGGGVAHTAIAILVLGSLAAITQFEVDTTFRRDIAGLGILVSVLLFLPLQPLYFPVIVFPLCMVLYTIPSGRDRNMFLVGTLLTLLHLDQESILLVTRIPPLPDAWGTSVIAFTDPLFTFVLPPTLGLWILLLTCVLIQLPSIGFEGPRTTATPT